MPDAALAPHSANAEVTPHGRPDSASVAKLSSTSAMAPATSGHGPCSQVAPRLAGRSGPTRRPWRRFSTTTVMAAMAANTSQLSSSAGARPRVFTSEIGLSCGSEVQNGMCAVAMTEPAMKASRVTIMRVLPPPTVYSVPEAQPPPSCMPTPNRKAPMTTEVPAGETRPVTGLPNRVPADSAGKNSATPTASMIICARRPAPRPSAMNTRHDEVKPKAAWYSARPSRAPTTNRAACLALTACARYSAPSRINSSDTPSGVG